jgi:exopolyphosphatase/guanosine-5'-triphosphate,3'-diphosphate pyrophosphatase
VHNQSNLIQGELKRKVAVIDLGTNTFNLLIAEISHSDFEVIHSEKEGVALGMGGINLNFITEDAFQRGLNCLIHFKKICSKHQVEKIRAIGTSALRDAKNNSDFLKHVYTQTGIEIEIVSGEKEAELIYKGVSWFFPFNEKAVIMDIGGGSTEFIFADKTGVLAKKSFNIGVSRIFQEFKFSDPYSSEDILKVERFLDHEISDFFDKQNCKILIGATGCFETFYEMIHKTEFLEKKKALVFPEKELEEIISWVIHSTQIERDEHPYIIPIRRKMAPIAAIKTNWVRKKLAITRNFITPCALKEGVLKEF